MRLKVVSNGVGIDTRFIDIDTGTEFTLPGLESVEWRQDKGAARLMLTFVDFELEASGAVKITKPTTKIDVY